MSQKNNNTQIILDRLNEKDAFVYFDMKEPVATRLYEIKSEIEARLLNQLTTSLLGSNKVEKVAMEMFAVKGYGNLHRNSDKIKLFKEVIKQYYEPSV